VDVIRNDVAKLGYDILSLKEIQYIKAGLDDSAKTECTRCSGGCKIECSQCVSCKDSGKG